MLSTGMAFDEKSEAAILPMIKREDIIKPLIFLDIFDYPPTAMELWRFLPVKAELGEVIRELSNTYFCHPERSASEVKDPVLPGRINHFTLDKGNLTREGTDPSPASPKLQQGGRGAQDDKEKNGFYFFPGREALIDKRREFDYLAEQKFKIAKRAAWLLHFIPGIRMAAVCNNFYYRPESDIDFFIITAANRLWLTRFFATIILDLFRLRARGKKTADRICLSFYLSENNLNLERIALKKINGNSQVCGSLTETDSSPASPELQQGGPGASPFAKATGDRWDDEEVDDPYLSYWLAFLEPIYGQECYNRFWETNAWIKNVFPNALPKSPVSRRRVEDNFLSLLIKKVKSIWFFGALGNICEKIAKRIQWQKLSPRIKEMATVGDTRVVINDAMLKFHENDRREEYKNNYKLRITDYKL